MKFKLLFSLLLSGALGAAAEGYVDGIEYFRADQPEEAAIILTNTLNQPGTDQATAYYYLGQIALKNGDKSGAQAYFNKGMTANPNNALNYIGLGALALRNNDVKDAKDYFNKAKGMAKKDADVLTEIPRAYFEANPVAYSAEIDKWLADINKTAKNLAPAPYILEGDMLAGTNVGESAGKYEMAATFDHESKNAQDAHPEAYVKYARVIFKVNRNGAIQKLRELLGYQPNSALVQRELAEKLYDADQLSNALKQYEELIKNPNSFKTDKQRLAGLYFFAERYQDSYDLASKVLADDPGNFYMQRMQFYNKKALKENEAALKAAEALFANPKAQLNAQDYMQYADLLSDMGDNDKALTMYETAVKVDPSKTALLKDLSSAYNKAGQFEKAAETMQAFVDSEGADVNPNDLLQLAMRYNALAQSELKDNNDAWKDNAAKALKIINQVADNKSLAAKAIPVVLNYKANILQTNNKGEYNQTIVDADLATLAALDADPANLEANKQIYTRILGRMGNYYASNKDKAKALPLFERLYQLQPSEELAKFIDGLK